MELMVVSAILATTVALALPAMGAARAEGKSNEIALDLVRVARQARAASTAYGRAHLLRYSAVMFGRGGVQVYRGINNNCNTNVWVPITAGGCTGNVNCIAEVDPRDWENSYTQYNIRLQNFGGTADICFEPTGIVRWRRPLTPTTRFLSDNISGGTQIRGGFEFHVTRTDGNGVTRRMLMPLGGDARTLR